jgi:hypothetical protein
MEFFRKGLIGVRMSTRVIEAYVDNLNLKKLGFKIPKLETGKPPYNPHDLKKIYLYGY